MYMLKENSALWISKQSLVIYVFCIGKFPKLRMHYASFYISPRIHIFNHEPNATKFFIQIIKNKTYFLKNWT